MVGSGRGPDGRWCWPRQRRLLGAPGTAPASTPASGRLRVDPHPPGRRGLSWRCSPRPSLAHSSWLRLHQHRGDRRARRSSPATSTTASRAAADHAVPSRSAPSASPARRPSLRSSSAGAMTPPRAPVRWGRGVPPRRGSRRRGCRTWPRRWPSQGSRRASRARTAGGRRCVVARLDAVGVELAVPLAELHERGVGVGQRRPADVGLVLPDRPVLLELLADLLDEGLAHARRWSRRRRGLVLKLKRTSQRLASIGVAAPIRNVSTMPLKRVSPKPGPSLSTSMRPSTTPRGVGNCWIDRMIALWPSVS